jgi:hypothetical protein
VSKDVGPRERALREQREARFEENQRKMREQSKAEKLDGLKERVAVAAKKTGKSRKKK